MRPRVWICDSVTMLRPVSQVAAAVGRAAGPAGPAVRLSLGPSSATFGGPVHLTPAGVEQVCPAFGTEAIHTALPHGQRVSARAMASATPSITPWAHEADAAPPVSAPTPSPTERKRCMPSGSVLTSALARAFAHRMAAKTWAMAAPVHTRAFSTSATCSTRRADTDTAVPSPTAGQPDRPGAPSAPAPTLAAAASPQAEAAQVLKPALAQSAAAAPTPAQEDKAQGAAAGGGTQQASSPAASIFAWWQLPLGLTIIAAVSTVVSAFISPVVTRLQEGNVATVAAEFEKRRLAAIKARILSHAPPAMPEPSEGRLQVAPIKREEVTKMLQGCSARPLVIIAPKGDGKTTAMIQWAHANPYLIYADVSRETTYTGGVKAVAQAIGYATIYSDDEQRARKNGCKLPELDFMGEEELKDILELYMKACDELRSEGKLSATPTLVLDHSTRPLTVAGRNAQDKIRNYVVDDLDQPQQEKRSTVADTLIRVFLDAAKAERGCRFCIVTSDVYAEQSAILCSAPWDEIDYVRLPPFKRHEAKQLIIFGIHERIKASQSATAAAASESKPRPSEPTAEQVLAIERDYSKTIDFLLHAVGYRPRRLLACLAKAAPMTDAELQANRPAMPAALKELLPARLQDSVVDPDVAAALAAELTHFRRAVSAMLAVSYDIVIPPSISPAPTPGEQRIKRVLLVDRLLRQLLQGPRDRVDIEIDFTGRNAVLDRLLSFHILFLDGSPKAGTIAYESDAVRDIASNILNSNEHAKRMELVRTLLEWQRAASKAERLAQQPQTIRGFVGDALGYIVSQAAAARARVAELERRLEVLRVQVAGGRPAVRASTGPEENTDVISHAFEAGSVWESNNSNAPPTVGFENQTRKQ